jgi:hypothetical protein
VDRAKLAKTVGDTVIAFRGREIYHQAVMVSAGFGDLAASGKTSDEAGALQRGEEVFALWRKAADVSIDPRFGTVAGDTLDYAAPGGSLSVRVSALARSAAAAQADKAYVASLPASQRCGGG